MDHAIPTNITAMDMDADGTMDRFYAIDIMGQIFRVDFNNKEGTEDNERYVPDGRLYANLASGDRRFYNPVNAAVSQVGAEYRIHLNVGSGRRPNPLNRTSSDQFYSVIDRKVFEDNLPPTDELPVVQISDLVNTTTSISLDHDYKGWYFNLAETGEKVLSKASARGGFVFFTSYVPPEPLDPDAQVCEPPLGTGYLYAIYLGDSGALDNDRRIRLQPSGIPASPMFLTLEQNPPDNPDLEDPYTSQDSKTVLLVGTEMPKLDNEDAQNTLENALNKTAEKVYWQKLK
jgi:type IV pilus assembly protein PilY1